MLGDLCVVPAFAGGLRRADPQSVGELSAALCANDHRIHLLSSLDLGAVWDIVPARLPGSVLMRLIRPRAIAYQLKFDAAIDSEPLVSVAVGAPVQIP